MSLLVLVPTRGRPDNAKRLLAAIDKTTEQNVAVVFCVDDNDPALSGYVEVLPRQNITVGEPARLGPWLNRLAPEMAEHFDALGFMGDDHVPETPAWDLAVTHAMNVAGQWGMAYGDDGYQGERLPTAIFMQSSLVDRLGWMVPPGLEHLYIDNAWKDIGRASGGLRYLPHVKITHKHYAVGMAEEDETYRAGNSRAQYARDKATYRMWQRNVLPHLFPET